MASILPFHFPVVLKAKVNRQPPADVLRKCQLFSGNGDAHHVRPVLFGGEFRKAAPSTAKLKDGHPRLQANFPAHQVELCLLGFIQGGGVFPVAAGVIQEFVEESAVQVIPQVINDLAHFQRPGTGLKIDEPGL